MKFNRLNIRKINKKSLNLHKDRSKKDMFRQGKAAAHPFVFAA